MNSKSYAVVFTKKSPSVYCDWERFKIRNIGEGVKDGEEFITYGVWECKYHVVWVPISPAEDMANLLQKPLNSITNS